MFKKKIKGRGDQSECYFHFTKSCNTVCPRRPLLAPPAQFEYQASEGPNINTFYSSSHQGELQLPPPPTHQSSKRLL